MVYSLQRIQEFQRTVWDYYKDHARALPWRSSGCDGYEILVSEMMLQQTQVTRVIPKYQEFIVLFPDVKHLADAPLGEVLRTWQGLGYNRRAKYLHDAARKLQAIPEPWSLTDLTSCKGIGVNTAAAVLTYAYDQRQPFIETNIRAIYIHHFFPERTAVADAEILAVVELTLPDDNYREWFWALMDYGTHLKSTHGNTARASKHYVRQSRFEGSKRQLRGEVLRRLANGGGLEDIDDERLATVLMDLSAERLIERKGGTYRLHGSPK